MNNVQRIAQALTTEEKLKAIIEAQVRGGFEEYDFLRIDTEVLDTGYVNGRVRSRHILEILLDTNGIRVVYGDEIANGGYRHVVSQSILEALESGKGNNYEAAIDCAYNLLPAH